MGMFDSIYLKDVVCPYCKIKQSFEFQTKHLRCLLDRYKLGSKLKLGAGLYGITPQIKDGVLKDCIAVCESKKCNEIARQEKKEKGWKNFEFARTYFYADIEIKNGKIAGIKRIKKDKDFAAFMKKHAIIKKPKLKLEL